MKYRILLGAVIFVCATASAVDWPYLRGPGNDGITGAKLGSLLPAPEVLWKAPTSKGNGGVVVADGLAVIFATGNKNLTCLNADTGEEIWSKGSMAEWHGNQTPALHDGKIFVQTYQLEKNPPLAWCLDAKTGREIWKVKLPLTGGKRGWGMAASPLILDGIVYFNAGSGAALKLATGETVWTHDGWPGLATPVLFQQGRNDAIAFFLGDRLVARDRKSGRELWSIDWPTSSAVNACRPTFIDGKVVINSGYGLGPACYDISGGTPKEVWKLNRVEGHSFAASILHEGQVYGFFKSSLGCMNPADGTFRWKARGNGSVLLIDNHFVWVTERGELKIGPVSKDGFEPLVTAQIHEGIVRNNPAYVDGKLYLKNADGEVVCVRISR